MNFRDTRKVRDNRPGVLYSISYELQRASVWEIPVEVGLIKQKAKGAPNQTRQVKPSIV